MTRWAASDGGTASSTATLTSAIVRSVADREATDPKSLPPLYYSVDVEALAAVVESMDEQSAGRVSFSYNGYAITVDGAGRITIDERAE